jgi:hypothetical protein
MSKASRRDVELADRRENSGSVDQQRKTRPVGYLVGSSNAESGASETPGVMRRLDRGAGGGDGKCSLCCLGISAGVNSVIVLAVLAFLVAMYLKMEEMAQAILAAKTPPDIVTLISGEVASSSSSSGSSGLWYTREFPRGVCDPMPTSFFELSAIDINGTNRTMGAYSCLVVSHAASIRPRYLRPPAAVSCQPRRPSLH